jgi:4-diphosphocytidyl-2-C-methyl-D-erythritol kinase
MRVRAFAKINLSLRVLGTRADGYHELRTIFQSIALHDTLTIRSRRGPFHLACDDPSCPADEANLIWRAAARVWRAAGRRGAPRDVAVGLTKRIPLQAGLGGGSSDAAAALRAFARMWRVDEARVRAIGRELGADVPYFFEGGTVLGLERGDLLFPLVDRPAAWAVLVLPNVGVSTKEAFSWFDSVSKQRARGAQPSERLPGRRSPERLALHAYKPDRLALHAYKPERLAFHAYKPTRLALQAYELKGLALRADEMVNDLEPVVVAHHPEIARVIRALRKAGAGHAAMTGSGSTVFGLFRSETAASRAARALASRARRTVVTRTVNRPQYHRLAGI